MRCLGSEKNVKIGILLDIYGKLLTEKQYKLLDDYYNKDLSLSEIAENEKITRQAVRDNLLKGENNLLEYDEKLNLLNTIKEIDEIKELVNSIESKNRKIIDKIIKKLDKLY